MDISLLVKFIAPHLPFLLSVGDSVLEGASQKVGQDIWEKAKVVWNKLMPRVEAKTAALEAAQDLARRPEDEELQIALKVQLKKILQDDATLKAELTKILSEDILSTSGGDNINQQVSGDGNQTIGKMEGSAKVINRMIGDVNM